MGYSGDELSRLEIELFQFVHREFKVETFRPFREQEPAREPRSIQLSSQYLPPQLECKPGLFNQY
jgi:hypothetical protein